MNQPTQPAPPLPALLLYSRDGCCLCEGLEERLRSLVPPPPLQVVNVDHDPDLQARYGLEVPLLAVVRQGHAQLLPRVGPRLGGDGLQRWLRKCLAELPGPPPSA
ncbi:glutaredoxin family protein [Synechococcus sp. CBW1107]|uniref:glutaredoxin family protein n=1 Tax=Synechococcus sp. CBW1107 TaxID=2789857 RepID=UPI002AD21875|nr:glutaredoxin family protein [Synechococcus sp. CBW1107]